MLYTPLSLKSWIDKHREILKPPVGNKMIWRDREFIVMAVGGPNTRTDYHINQGEEFFYQVEGDMVLKVKTTEGEDRDICIHEGEIYLLPANTPHSPQRPEGTVGIVVERRRLAHEEDGFVWFCKKCGEKLYEEFFHLTNIEVQLPQVFDRYYSNKENTTCKKCHMDNGKGH